MITLWGNDQPAQTGSDTLAVSVLLFMVVLFSVGAACFSALFFVHRIPNAFLRWISSIGLSLVVAIVPFWGTGAAIALTLGYEDTVALGVASVVGIATFFCAVWWSLSRGSRDAETVGAPRTAHSQRQRGPSPAQPNTPSKPFAPPDVFISYKRDERPQVEDIAKRLEDLNVSVWFDAELNSGLSFDAEIDRNIREAKCVLVCWSPGAVASEWVRGEATIGRQRGVLAASMLKPSDLPAPFNLIHAEDLTAGSHAQNPAWLKLLGRIGELIGRPGLAGFAALSESRDKAAISAWLAEHPHDPLFDRAVAMLKAG